MPDIRVRDLTMEYSSGGYVVRPFDHFDLDLSTGDLALLLGASGCGKTTLLSMLASILTPTSGSIHVGDIEVTELKGADLAAYRRRTVGVVFQSFNLVPSLTAQENIYVGDAPRRGRTQGREVAFRGAPGDGRPRGSHAPPAGQALGRATATRGDRPRARARSAAHRGRRADRVTRLRAGRRRDPAAALARGAGPRCRHRDPRRTAPAARRPCRGAHAAADERVASTRAGRARGRSGALPSG